MDFNGFSPQRAASTVVSNPMDAYNSWLADYNNRRSAYASSAGSAPSFHDNLVNSIGDSFNQQYGTPDNSTVSDADRVANWFNTYTNAEKAFEPTQWAGIDPTFTTGPADQGVTTPVQSAEQNTLGPTLYGSIAGYAPAPLDFSAFDAEKAQREKQFGGLFTQQKALQDAYNAQLGGGVPGGVLADPTAFAASPNATAPNANATGGLSTMPWETPGYSTGGLGGLGGYNPNPWSTSNTNAAAPAGNPFGGPFGNKNPFSPGG